jgi:hypothetical protein
MLRVESHGGIIKGCIGTTRTVKLDLLWIELSRLPASRKVEASQVIYYSILSCITYRCGCENNCFGESCLGCPRRERLRRLQSSIILY